MAAAENAIVVGASPKPDRYSYKAIQQLLAAGHTVRGVHPVHREVLGVEVYPTLTEAAEAMGGVDTITLYLNPSRSGALLDELLELKPKRVIFNPGAENEKLAADLEKADITPVEACTLVLLSTGQY